MAAEEQGRQRALLCMKDRVPLSGQPGKSDAGGIEELRLVVAEMAKLKAGAGAGGLTPPADAAAAAGGLTPAVGVFDDDMDPSSDAAVDMDPLVISCDDEVEADPVEQRACALAEKELGHIAIHGTSEAFKEDFMGRVFRDQKVVFFIDAPTSKLRIVSDSMKIVEGLSGVGRFAVFIPVGRRFELLAAVTSNAKRMFPKHAVFMVQCEASGTQSARVQPTYAVYLPVPGSEATTVPTSVRVNSCKAASHECLRLRCKDRHCKLRPSTPTTDAPADVQEELHQDDVEEGLEDYDMFEETEDDGNDGLQTETTGDLCGGPQRPYLVDLFPFARPIAHYVGILRDVCHAESASHLAVISRTGHPAALIAGRECGLEVFGLFNGVKPHGLAHGKVLLEWILTKSRVPQAKADVGQATKRPHGCDMSVIAAQAPPEQLVQLRDVHIDVGNWREGVNRVTDGLPTKTARLLQQELDDNQLLIQRTDAGMCLCSLRPLKEGQVICPLSALLFDSRRAVQTFFDDKENVFLADRVVCVENVHRGEDLTSVWAVLVGAGRHVRHYAGIRRAGANASIEVDCAAGARAGFLTLRVKTRNGQGIAARAAIVANFGLSFDVGEGEQVAEQQDTKRLRGALDSYFWQNIEQAEERATPGGPGGLTPGGPGGLTPGGPGGLTPGGPGGLTPGGPGGLTPGGPGGLTPGGPGGSTPGGRSADTGHAQASAVGPVVCKEEEDAVAATPATGPSDKQQEKDDNGSGDKGDAKPAVSAEVGGVVVLSADIKPAGCSLVWKPGPPASLWLLGGVASCSEHIPRTLSGNVAKCPKP